MYTDYSQVSKNICWVSNIEAHWCTHQDVHVVPNIHSTCDNTMHSDRCIMIVIYIVNVHSVTLWLLPTHLDDNVLAGVFFVESDAEWGHEILHTSIKYDYINNIKPFLGLYRQCRCCMRVNQFSTKGHLCGIVDWEHGRIQFSCGGGKINNHSSLLLKKLRKHDLCHLQENEKSWIKRNCGSMYLRRGVHVCMESVGKEGWREEEGGRGRERERERELYLDHGLTVDFNHFVQPRTPMSKSFSCSAMFG